MTLTDINHLGQATARSKSYTDVEISNVSALAVGAIRGVQPQAVSVTLDSSGWVKETLSGTAYQYRRDVALADVTAEDRLDLAPEPGYVEAARQCGLAPFIESSAGSVRFYAISVPTAPIVLSGTKTKVR